MECAESSRVAEYNFSYPRTSRILADDEVSCYNSSVNYHRHKSNCSQTVNSHNNNNNTNYKHYLKTPGIRIRSLHALPLQPIFIFATLLILTLSVCCASDINTFSNGENNQKHCKNCFIERNTTIFIVTDNLTHILRKISQKQSDLSMVLSVNVQNSNLGDLNLSDFYIFPKLESITVTNCSLRKIEGPTPETVLNLNISHNALRNISASVFMSMESNYIDEQSNGNGTLLKLKNIDLSHNNLDEFPENVFQLQELKSLKIFANPFRLDFVWDRLSKWYFTPGINTSILVDADEAECVKYPFRFSVLGVLKSKKTMEETCDALDKEQCHGCNLNGLHVQQGTAKGYPIIHTSKTNSTIAISLSIDCSSRNLTEMPDVPLYTWELNVSNNHITDLSPLRNNSNYSNLIYLEAENNDIDIDTLNGSTFLTKFSYLGLRNNRITSLSVLFNLLASRESATGEERMTLGNNYISCDCDTARDVKPTLIRLSKKIHDVNSIYCVQTSDHVIRVKDLVYSDVCKHSFNTATNEFWLYVLIATEVLLIIGVITKVWHDQRRFRQTGILPWCSAKMPRLPCDAMLEGLKDHPNHNNNNGHQPLQSSQKEMRSGSSCTTKSGKSSRSSSAQSSSV